MKANELKIGNLVKNWTHILPSGKIEPGSVHTIEASDFPDWAGLYEPIPITDEWLLKFGFYHSKENAGKLDCFKLRIITHATKLLTIAEWIESPLGHWQVWIELADATRIEYVHQLQNLYFALTGEELRINK